MIDEQREFLMLCFQAGIKALQNKDDKRVLELIKIAGRNS